MSVHICGRRGVAVRHRAHEQHARARRGVRLLTTVNIYFQPVDIPCNPILVLPQQHGTLGNGAMNMASHRLE